MANSYLWLATLPCIMWGCYKDIKKRKIPKISTVPIFLFGVIYHYLNGGIIGAGVSIAGAAGFFVYLIFLGRLPAMILNRSSAASRMGGGDAKLALACGAVVGINSLWLMMALYPVVNLVFDVVLFVKDMPDKKPVAIIKSTVKQFWAEIYGYSPNIERALAPFIAISFILTMAIKQIGGL